MVVPGRMIVVMMVMSLPSSTVFMISMIVRVARRVSVIAGVL